MNGGNVGREWMNSLMEVRVSIRNQKGLRDLKQRFFLQHRSIDSISYWLREIHSSN